MPVPINQAAAAAAEMRARMKRERERESERWNKGKMRGGKTVRDEGSEKTEEAGAGETPTTHDVTTKSNSHSGILGHGVVND